LNSKTCPPERSPRNIRTRPFPVNVGPGGTILYLTRAFLARAGALTGAALIALLAVGGVGLGAAEVLRAPATPDLAALGALALAIGPVVLGTGLPLAALVGVAAALGQWRDEGEWLALRSAGWGGRALLPALLAVALAVGAASWALNHWLEPAARAQIRHALREGLHPAPGRVLDLGATALVADEVDGERLRGLFFATEEGGGALVVGTAARGSLTTERLVLEDGLLHAPGDPALGVAFERAELPLALPGVRVELVERSDASLEAVIERMQADGRDASYERAVLEKRSAWPLASALMVLLAGPLALGGRAWALGGAVLGYWAAVRGFDHAAASLGGAAAAWSPPLLLALACAAAWLGWRER
jgi:lipopolysaccharide export LptBFGC system permease protein LptF